MVPQWGCHQQVHVASRVPEQQIPYGLKPIGYLRTQPQGISILTPLDILFHCSVDLSEHSVIGTCCLAPERSVKLYKLTREGYQWGLLNVDIDFSEINPESLPSFSARRFHVMSLLKLQDISWYLN